MSQRTQPSLRERASSVGNAVGDFLTPNVNRHPMKKIGPEPPPAKGFINWYKEKKEEKQAKKKKQKQKGAQTLANEGPSPGSPSSTAPLTANAAPDPTESSRSSRNTARPMSAVEYPRPDFQPKALSWNSLDGPWDLLFDDGDVGLQQGWHRKGIPQSAGDNGRRSINVPFVFQCEASGINERDTHEVLWYGREISDLRHGHENPKRILLRFGAVDYHAKVWLEGHFVGEHEGGHVPFDFDLTDIFSLIGSDGPKRLILRVFDSAYDKTQPRGKQYWGPKSEDIYYTPSSGIWQSVWLEAVPRLRIADSSHGTVFRTNNIDAGTIDARIAVLGRRIKEDCHIEVTASIAGIEISRSKREPVFAHEDFVRFNQDVRLSERHIQALSHALPPESLHTNNVALWSPEHPTLYDLHIRLFGEDGTVADEVATSIGMRHLDWTRGDSTFRLNHQPYFHALLLDQGYWPATLMTPPSADALRTDIQLSKAMGFNGCRKHQKVEDPRFLYWADRLGFMVWGEMAAGFTFSNDYVERFDREWRAAVKRDLNHPCVVAWTPVNESWGYPDLGRDARQRNHLRSLYHATKTMDPTRPVNDNCGWDHAVTDLSTFHDYADAKGMAERCDSVGAVIGRGRSMFLPPVHGQDDGCAHKPGAPILCTECGGVNVAAPGADGDSRREVNWGYSTAKDEADLLKRVEWIVMATVGRGNVCGIVWTQTTDIEQEQNGLYTADRQPKVSVERMRNVIAKAREAYLANRPQ